MVFPLDTEWLPDSSPTEFYGNAAASFRPGDDWELLPESAGANF